MDSDGHGADRIATEFSLKEGQYYLAGNRLDLKVRLTAHGQYIGPTPPISSAHHNPTAYGQTANLQNPVNPGSNAFTLEPVKLSSQSYYLDGDLCEILGINYGLATYWYAYRGSNRVVELDMHKIDRRIYRGSAPTSHDLCDVYQVDSQANEVYHLNLVGFTNGQVQLTDYRGGQNNAKLFNEERTFEQSKVTVIKWLPNSESDFVVGHNSGAIYHYSGVEPNHSGLPVFVPVAQKDTFVVYQSRAVANTTSKTIHSSSQTNAGHSNQTPSNVTARNPLFKWLVGDGAVNDLEFAPVTANRSNISPSTLILAIATADGFVRIFDFGARDMIGRLKSYFGSMLCVGWSGDGLLLAAGAEDDLVHIYSMEEQRVVFRCQGHKSWVSAVAFDNHFVQSKARESLLLSRTISHSHNRKARSYRLGSVSHDTHFCLWDIDDSLLLASRRTRTRSSVNSVSQHSQVTTPRTSESQHNQSVSSVSSAHSSQHASEKTVSSAAHGAEKSSSNLARSNSLPGSKANTVVIQTTDKNASANQQASTLSSKFAGMTTTTTTDATSVASAVSQGHSHKKDKNASLSMFKASSNGSGSSKAHSKMLHHINRQKVKVQEESHLVFGSAICPKNGTIPNLEPVCKAKASHERLTSIRFMANCFVVAGNEGFVLVYARPKLQPSPIGSPRHSQSASGEFSSALADPSNHQLGAPQQKPSRSYNQLPNPKYPHPHNATLKTGDTGQVTVTQSARSSYGPAGDAPSGLQGQAHAQSPSHLQGSMGRISSSNSSQLLSANAAASAQSTKVASKQQHRIINEKGIV